VNIAALLQTQTVQRIENITTPTQCQLALNKFYE